MNTLAHIRVWLLNSESAVMANQSKFARPQPYPDQQQQAQNFMHFIRQLVQNSIDCDFFTKCRDGTPKQVKALLDKGIDVNMRLEGLNGWNTPLCMVVMNRNKRVARLIIERGADVNALAVANCLDGYTTCATPLCVAAAGGFEKVARLLIQHKADVNAMGISHIRRNGEYVSFTPLGLTMAMGNSELAQYLLKNGAHVNKPCIDSTIGTRLVFTALFQNPKLCFEKCTHINEETEFQVGELVGTATMMGVALLHNNEEIIKVLLERGADIDSPALTLVTGGSKAFFTPLSWAMLYGSDKMVTLLLKYGADRNKPIATDITGISFTPLSLIICSGWSEKVAELIKNGADVNGALKFSTNERDISCTLLGIATSCRSYIEVDLLLKNGADPNQPLIDVRHSDSDSMFFITPLMAALLSGDKNLAVALLEHGAKANATGMQFQGKTKEGQDVIFSLPHLFGTAESAELAKLLLKQGCEIDVKVEIRTQSESFPLTALAIAACIPKKKNDILQFLLEHGAQVNYQDFYIGVTALACASLKGCCENVRILLKHDAEVNQIGRLTALTAACLVGDYEVANILLEHGAEVDLQDSTGMSPLMSAIKSKSDDGRVLVKKDLMNTVQLLLEHNAQVDIRSSVTGKTALDLAREEGLTDIVELLAERVGTSNTVENRATCNDAEGENRTKSTQTSDIDFMSLVQILVETLNDHNKQVDKILQAVVSRQDKFESQFATMASAMGTVTCNVQEGFQTQGETATVLTASPASNTPPRQQDSERLKLAEAHKILKQIASEWENISMYLGLPEDEIKSIKMQEHNIIKNCLRELLSLWLKRVNPPPTWQALAEAVREVNEQVAKQIEDTHILRK